MAKKKKNTKKKKIKVLAYCDSPTVATGFGTVSRNIFEGLYRTGRYDIDIFGINYWGDPHEYPYRIWPAGTNSDRDPYGRKKFLEMAPQMEFDILFVLQDSFIVSFLPELQKRLKAADKKCKTICYFPTDGTMEAQWVRNVDAADYLVAYSEFGRTEAKKVLPSVKDMSVIPHGVNTKDYFKLPEGNIKDFRRQYFGENKDKFIFTNLNRNQQRKDIPRTIAAFAEHLKTNKDSLLYLHMAVKDQGWDLDKVIKQYGLVNGKDVIFPDKFGPNQGYPREMVNIIYNMSDCIVSTTLGEGFGLSWIEAMATNTPVIMPDNTAMTEFITGDRGYLVDSGYDASHFTVVPNDNEVVRPLVNVMEMASTMGIVKQYSKAAAAKAETAYNWVTKNMDWQKHIAKMWVNKFDEVYKDLANDVITQPTINEETITTEVF